MSCCCENIADLGCFSFCDLVAIVIDPGEAWVAYFDDGVKTIKVESDDGAYVSLLPNSYEDLFQPGYSYIVTAYTQAGNTRITDGDGNNCWKITFTQTLG